MSASRRLFTTGLLTVAVLSATVVPASARTTITPLTPLPNGTTYGNAIGINDSGVIVGTGLANSALRAVKWTPDGKVTALNNLPGESGSSATAVNNSGTIAGYSFSPGTGETVVRWAPDGTIQALAKVPGYQDCFAQAINDSGVIVGLCDSGLDSRAARWNPDGTVVLLAMPGSGSSRALGINAAGAVVGSFSPTNSPTRAVRWNPDGSVTELPNLSGGVYSEARGINDRGQVTGTIVVSPPGITEQPVRWETDNTVTVLPTPANAPRRYGIGHKISPDGTVIGETTDAESRDVAASWSPNGTLTVLPDLAKPGTSNALAVNKRNVIVGNSDDKAVKWTPPIGIPCTVKPFCQ
jgi:uncharacterized membrane protein